MRRRAASGEARIAVVPLTDADEISQEVLDALADDHAVGGQRYHAGEVIAGKYRLESILGRGGMGAVWLARNLTLDTDVAIKLVRADLAHPDVAARLMIEAKAAARLEHRAIVRVFDYGSTSEGDPFIVMEVVRGEDLAELLGRKGNLPAATAVPLLLPLASALSAAHARGIVHRDVKPENVILMTGDEGLVVPKLVDFGVARVELEGGKRRLTQQGHVVGTPDYMAPEQAMGRSNIDDRVDVWGFSVVLYETIAGRRPFEGDTHAEMMVAVLRDAPRPTTDFGAGDDRLWRIIKRGLEKDAEHRWGSMRAMGSELARWAIGCGIASDASGTSLSRQWLNEGDVETSSLSPSRNKVERDRKSESFDLVLADGGDGRDVGAPAPGVAAGSRAQKQSGSSWVFVTATIAAVVGLVAAGFLLSGQSDELARDQPAVEAVVAPAAPYVAATSATVKPLDHASALPSSVATSASSAPGTSAETAKSVPARLPFSTAEPPKARPVKPRTPPRTSSGPGLKPLDF